MGSAVLARHHSLLTSHRGLGDFWQKPGGPKPESRGPANTRPLPATQALDWQGLGISLCDRMPVIVATRSRPTKAPLAQLVEQLTLNQRVRGSKP
jgi:hypothetical protein